MQLFAPLALAADCTALYSTILYSEANLVPPLQDFVDLERLPYNRDYKGILGNILSICKAGRPKYRCRLIQMPEAEAQKFSLVPSKAPLPGTEELLWEAAVSPRMPSLPTPCEQCMP